MNNKALLSRAELEFTQKLQLHFPCGVIPEGELEKWNGCKADFLAKYIAEYFSKFPESATEPLIQSIGTVAIPTRSEEFVARDHFIVDMSETAKVKISSLSSNFRKNFLDKIEEPGAEAVLHYGKLLKSSKDDKIIIELGGKEKAETTLAEMFSLMEKQTNRLFVCFSTGRNYLPTVMRIFFIFAIKPGCSGRSASAGLMTAGTSMPTPF